ncbi:hypothetical protein EV363DRAFT_500753 [Boletus edulis]|uniref:NAD(P)-binding protein n=1 Tax=Boletus edulis BED1 TaxID=1328754 RepID=A0AAD4GFB6_BOLED|nr:hypothetical protein EV363DRAFT_500753 [Boletus edulis]KAF8440493.1 hypothetical protein L210DRAFT_447192 [Boletus edulis BED1]
MARPRVWLITGASSGFGRSLTELILKRGEIVVATLRKPEMLQDLWARYPEDKLLVLKVDVTNPAELNHAFAQTREIFGRLDVVFNNAGSFIVGEAEMTSIGHARALFDVNFWGAVLVSRASVKFFREVNEPGRGGLLLQVSSLAGFVGPPAFSFFAASKHALEGFSNSLAKELLPQWNIKICILQIGSFDTNGLRNALVLPESEVYNDRASPFTNLRNILIAPGFKFEGDPNKFAKSIYSLVESGNIPLHVPIGKDALMVAKEVVALREQEISAAASLSTDLLRDDL